MQFFDVVSKFAQLDGRKKRTAKRLSVTNVTGLLLTCFVHVTLTFFALLKKHLSV